MQKRGFLLALFLILNLSLISSAEFGYNLLDPPEEITTITLNITNITNIINRFDQSLNTTDDVTFDDVTLTGIISGFFNWAINLLDGSNQYLTFNGTTLSFNQTHNNLTIQDKSLNETEANATYLKLTGKNANQKIRLEPFTISVPTPSAPNDSANKEYVDDAVAGINFDFFLNDGDSDIIGYFNMTEEDLDVAETTLTTSSLPVGVTTIFNFTTLEGQPEFTTLIGGIYDAHIHLQKSSPGTRDVKIFWELYNRTGSIENLLLTGETSPSLTGDDTEYDIHGVLLSEQMLNSGDRLIFKVIANITGGGANPTVTITMQGTTDSHFTIKTTTGAFEAIFLRQDGSKPLVDNWNVGNFDITNIANVGIGTSTPTHELHVVGDALITNNLTINASSGSSYFRLSRHGLSHPLEALQVTLGDRNLVQTYYQDSDEGNPHLIVWNFLEGGVNLSNAIYSFEIGSIPYFNISREGMVMNSKVSMNDSLTLGTATSGGLSAGDLNMSGTFYPRALTGTMSQTLFMNGANGRFRFNGGNVDIESSALLLDDGESINIFTSDTNATFKIENTDEGHHVDVIFDGDINISRQLNVLGTGNNFFNGNVGIGTTTPTHEINIVGNANISDTLFVPEIDFSDEAVMFIDGDDLWIDFEQGGIDDGTFYLSSGGENFIVAGLGSSTGIVTDIDLGTGNKITLIGGVNITKGLNITDGDLNVLNGNVGIGTNSPDSLLHLQKADTVTLIVEDTSADGIAGINLKNDAQEWTTRIASDDSFQLIDVTGGSTVPLRILPSAPTLSMDLRSNEIVLNQGGVDLDFRVEANGVASALFVQGNDGNVGIGINNPSKSLTFGGSNAVVLFDDVVTNFQGMRFNGASDNRWFMGATRSGSTFSLRIGIPNDGASDNLRNFQIFDGQGGNNVWFHVNQVGDIGIGTTVPASKLHIFETSNTDVEQVRIEVKPTSTSVAPQGAIVFYSPITTGGSLATFHSGRIVSGFESGAGGFTIGKVIIQTPTGVGTWDDTLIAKNGQVGIGTTNPADALTVVGDVNISGCVQQSNGTIIGGVCVSSELFKENFQPILFNREKFKKLGVYEFEWKQDKIVLNKTREILNEMREEEIINSTIIQVEFFNETSNQTEYYNNQINETILLISYHNYTQEYQEVINLDSQTKGFNATEVREYDAGKVVTEDGIDKVVYSWGEWLPDIISFMKDSINWNEQQDSRIDELESRETLRTNCEKSSNNFTEYKSCINP